MRSTALLILLSLLLPACGDDAAPESAGPSYLNIGPERWAELITSDDIETQQREMNYLGRGRTDSIPVVAVLLDHPDPKVAIAAYSCLEASLTKVKRNGHDVTPWIPLIDQAVASPHPRVAELAPELRKTYVGE